MNGFAAVALGAGIGVCAAVGALLQASQPVNHDVGWLLVAAGRLANGASLYVDDVIEINPPLIFYLCLPPVLVSRALDLSAVVLFRVYVGVWIGVSLWACLALLRAVLGEGDRVGRGLVAVALAFAFAVAFHGDFGQREHLMAIAFAPYFVAAAGRALERPLPRWTGVTGLGAGIAIALKPHHALAWLGVEVAIAWARSTPRVWLRPESIVAVGVGGLYALAVVALHPAYFESMLPLVRETYGAYQKPLFVLVKAKDLALGGALALAAFAVGPHAARRMLARVFAIAAGGFYVAYLVQGTGWRYHLIPFQTFALAVIALGVAGVASGAARRGGVAVCVAVTVAGLVVGFVGWALRVELAPTWRDGAPWRAGDRGGAVAALADVIERYAPGGSVWFLSTRLRWAFPTLNHTDATWASRYPSLWVVPPIVRLRAQVGSPDAQARADRLERALLDAVVEDLDTRRPDLVFVDVAPRKPFLRDVGFDFVAFFSRDPRFAQRWRGYERVRRAGSYEVYRRRAALGP